MTIRVAAYCRVSSLDQVRDDLTVKSSLDTQEQSIREYAEKQGWKFIRAYIEPGISGEEFEARKALQSLLEAARSHEFDVVAVKVGDRLARDQAVYHQIVKLLEQEYRVQILNLANPSPLADPTAFTGKYDPARVIQHGLAGMFAAYDQAVRRNRMEAGRQAQVKAGRFIYGIAPFGYKIEEKINQGKIERIPIPDPDTYWILEQIPKWYLEDGLSIKQMCKRLDSLKIPTAVGREWRNTSLAKILSNPFYGGKFVYGRFPAHSRRYIYPFPPNVIIADHSYIHPWTWEQFEQIQRTKLTNAKKHPRTISAGTKNPFTGLLYCGSCGSGMSFSAAFAAEARNNVPLYVACNKYKQNSSFCTGNSAPVSIITDFILSDLQSFCDTEYGRFHTLLDSGSIIPTELLAGKRQLSELYKKLTETLPKREKNLDNALLDGTIESSKYKSMLSDLATERQETEADYSRLQLEIDHLSKQAETKARFGSMLEEFTKLRKGLDNKPLDKWTDKEKQTVKNLANAVYERIEIRSQRQKGSRKRTIDIRFKYLIENAV